MTFWQIHIPSDQLKGIIKFGRILIGCFFGLVLQHDISLNNHGTRLIIDISGGFSSLGAGARPHVVYTCAPSSKT